MITYTLLKDVVSEQYLSGNDNIVVNNLGQTFST